MSWLVGLLAATDPSGGVLDYLSRGGVLGLLALVIVGSVRKWWVPAWYATELERERDEWKSMALSGTRLAERSSSVLEEAISRGKQR